MDNDLKFLFYDPYVEARSRNYALPGIPGSQNPTLQLPKAGTDFIKALA